MKAVIHVGMNKTGSSSIQSTFAKLKSDRVHYVNWPRANHSELFVLLFEDEDRLEDYRGFAIRGDTRASLLERRKTALRGLQEELASATAPLIVFSGEVISNKRFENAAERLHSFFSDHCSDVSVIGYVRSPVSFMQSAFQQRLKGGINRLNLHNVWPAYRNRFENIDRIFGRENVTLKKFDPKSFAGSDVVIDFGHEIGVEIDPAELRRVNESLSLEAVALLFVQRRFGQGLIKGFRGAQRANIGFINILRGIGSTRFGFARTLVDPVVRKNAADLEWMETRLGTSLRDSASSAAGLIGSEDELVAVALENAGAVELLLAEGEGETARLPGGGNSPERLAVMLDALYQQVSDALSKKGKAAPRAQGGGTRP